MNDRSKQKTAVTVKSTGEDAYFAASNSARGFQSYYSDCFDSARVGRLYAVKGGPGTGKSRFLREVAESGEKHGYRTEYIYCSSDPDSLDGVILTKDGTDGIALLDATAPHVYEPNRPGYREEIVNLGAFWNGDRLRDERETIAEMNRQKQNLYRRAYRYLAGYGEMTAVRDGLVEPFLKSEAIRAYARKFLRDIPNGKGFNEQTALICSVGMSGTVVFDTYFASAKKRYRVEDCRGSAAVFMEAIYELAKKKKCEIRVSRDPILSEKIDGIYLPKERIAFAVSRGEKIGVPYRRVSLRRFVKTEEMHDIRGELNFSERMRRAMSEGAIETFRKIKKVHFSIEDIYIGAMDFGAKENFTKVFCQKLFEG